jgi:hypothetical protein
VVGEVLEDLREALACSDCVDSKSIGHLLGAFPA